MAKVNELRPMNDATPEKYSDDQPIARHARPRHVGGVGWRSCMSTRLRGRDRTFVPKTTTRNQSIEQCNSEFYWIAALALWLARLTTTAVMTSSRETNLDSCCRRADSSAVSSVRGNCWPYVQTGYLVLVGLYLCV